MTASRHPTGTGAYTAYQPPAERNPWLWVAVAVGLVSVALLAVLVKPVCRAEGPTSAEEAGVGIRHEQRAAVWFHCEPWISRVVTD